MKYSNDNNKVSESWMKRLFNKISNFLKSIFGVNSNSQQTVEKDITQLFQDIFTGKFKNSKERFPVQRNKNIITDIDVNKLLHNNYTITLENGKEIAKKVIYLFQYQKQL